MPTPEQMPALVRSVDRELRRGDPGIDLCFLPLSTRVINKLGVLPPRELRAVLMATYGRVSLRNAGKDEPLKITPRDISAVSRKEEMKAQPEKALRRPFSISEMTMLIIDPKTVDIVQ